jgi:homoserine dehydrogenase
MANFAIMGYGVVGSGVAELFYKNKASIEKNTGTEMDLKYILDIKDFSDSPYADKFTKNIDDILNDDSITTVAECMGGVNPAYQFVKSCLEKGKSVCTSNKELVAEKGDILLETAKKANCNFFFEASVGGAIPIIRPLHKCLAGNEITKIAGILNGTTNFILGKMINEQMDFKDALKMAQELGYAEKDSTADVEGHDACRKICILSSLVYGNHVYPKSVYTKGISSISIDDVECAEKLGSVIKLIAKVEKMENGKILPTVMPMIVPCESIISSVNDVFNAVMVYGNGMEKVMFYGRGAGKLPTASAVMGDIIEAVKYPQTIPAQTWNSSENDNFIEDYLNMSAKIYFRVSSADIRDIETESEYTNSKNETAFITKNEMTLEDAEVIKEKIEADGGKVLALMPVLND